MIFNRRHRAAMAALVAEHDRKVRELKSANAALRAGITIAFPHAQAAYQALYGLPENGTEAEYNNRQRIDGGDHITDDDVRRLDYEWQGRGGQPRLRRFLHRRDR